MSTGAGHPSLWEGFWREFSPQQEFTNSVETKDGLAHPGPAVRSVEGHQGGHGAGRTVLQGGALWDGLDQPGDQIQGEFFSP